MTQGKIIGKNEVNAPKKKNNKDKIKKKKNDKALKKILLLQTNKDEKQEF